MTNRRIRLLLNPSSGHGRAQRLTDAIGTHADIEIVATESAEHLVSTVRDSIDRRDSKILVAGGDGTLHQAIQSLARSSVAMGIVPCGSGNDLARSLGVPLDPVAAIRRGLSAPARKIDLGRIGDRYFAGAAGIGLNSEVARCAAARVSWIRGRWIYPYAVARALLGFNPPRTTVRGIDGDGSFEGQAMLVLVANMPYLGGGMLAAPDARPDDGRFDVIVLKKMSRIRLLIEAFPKVYTGRHMRLPQVRAFQVSDVELATDRVAQIYADGEPIAECGPEGVTVHMEPQALTVLV